jgi:hypothetical protein
VARIRTIKPEFFTSADIVELSAITRLLYIALWCEADREGRIEWKPKTFKLRYLAGDKVDIENLCQELLNAGLIILYGDQKEYGYIPKFGVHQHINPRESASRLPEPSTNDASATRQPRDSDAQVGKEGKGKEGVYDASLHDTSLPIGIPPLREEVIGKMRELGFLDPEFEATKFFDYWEGLSWHRGKEPMKNWRSSCNTWKTNSVSRGEFPGLAPSSPSTSPYGEGFGTDWGFDPDTKQKEAYTERGRILIGEVAA